MTREEAIQDIMNWTNTDNMTVDATHAIANIKKVCKRYEELLTKFTKLKDLDLVVGGKELQDEAKELL